MTIIDLNGNMFEEKCEIVTPYIESKPFNSTIMTSNTMDFDNELDIVVKFLMMLYSYLIFKIFYYFVIEYLGNKKNKIDISECHESESESESDSKDMIKVISGRKNFYKCFSEQDLAAAKRRRESLRSFKCKNF